MSLFGLAWLRAPEVRLLAAVSLLIAACDGTGYSLGHADPAEGGDASSGDVGGGAGTLGKAGAKQGGTTSGGDTVGDGGNIPTTNGGAAGLVTVAGSGTTGGSGTMGGAGDLSGAAGADGGAEMAGNGGNPNGGNPNGGSAGMGNGGMSGMSGTGNNAGNGGSAGMGNGGNAGSGGSAGSGGNGGSAGNGGSGGSAGNGGSSDIGKACGNDFDCAGDEMCVYHLFDACNVATPTCQARPNISCKTVQYDCGCGFKTVAVPCDAPPGYAALPTMQQGACVNQNGQKPVCGDGIVGTGEQCDDGNLLGGDGCTATCLSETVVVPASDFECALSSKGQVKCWGRNNYGQLGQGDVLSRGTKPGQMGANLAPIALGAGRRALKVVVGDSFACALLDNHSVKCWGRNHYGQLGQGDILTRGDDPSEMGDNLKPIDLGTGRTALDIGAMSVDACAVLDDHTIKCWGFDGGGELCLGNNSPGGNTLARGDEAGEMGDNLQRALLGTKKKILSIAAGMYHACALFEDKTIKCWGVNSPPVLGYGDTNDRGNWLPELGDNLPAVDVGKGRTVKSVVAGVYHTCAILDDDTTKCWGSNFYGQLGLGDNVARGGNPGEMGDALPVVNLGTGRHATKLALGNSFTCAVLDDNTLKCWGQNTFGQAGTGDAVQRGDNAGEMGDALPVVNLGTGRIALNVGASKSGFETSAQTDERGWKAFGNNDYGQLGLGKTSVAVGTVPSDMGDNLPYLDLAF